MSSAGGDPDSLQSHIADLLGTNRDLLQSARWISQHDLEAVRASDRSTHQERWYQIKMWWGIFNVLCTMLGFYFAYRWTRTILDSSDEVRRSLIGEPFFSWFNGKESALAGIIICYLCFSLIVIVVSTISWEMSMEADHAKIKPIREKSKQVANFNRTLQASQRYLVAPEISGSKRSLVSPGVAKYYVS